MILRTYYSDITETISKEKFPKGLRITIAGGAGQRGEGEFGGEGGLGEVKVLYFDPDKDVTINCKFEKKAHDGENTEPFIYQEDFKLSSGLKGGNAGADVTCVINDTTVVSNGGGGGGAGGEYIYFNSKNHIFYITGKNGGSNSCGILNYSANCIKGGRGQDGDSNLFINSSTGFIDSKFLTNKENAYVKVESL